jgi:hypothetical protein
VDMQACPFQMDVHCEGCPPSLQPLSLDWGSRLLNQALQKSIVASAGEARALRGHDNVLVYTYRGDHRISSLVANKVERGWTITDFCLNVTILFGMALPKPKIQRT